MMDHPFLFLALISGLVIVLSATENATIPTTTTIRATMVTNGTVVSTTTTTSTVKPAVTVTDRPSVRPAAANGRHVIIVLLCDIIITSIL